jgi:hypothetical protein
VEEKLAFLSKMYYLCKIEEALTKTELGRMGQMGR